MGDPPGGAGDPVQRLEQAAGDQPAENDRDGADQCEGDSALRQQLVQRALADLLDGFGEVGASVLGHAGADRGHHGVVEQVGGGEEVGDPE
jgi:hypothetical protein